MPTDPSNDEEMPVHIIKKYSNRRLYDTEDSRYITLDELATKIRKGADVQVIDAKSGEDLTQATLTQIILEGPTSRLLPVPLLQRLIRMSDDAVAEFFSKYATWALDLYISARDGAQQASSMLPFGSVPMQATHAMLRWLSGGTPPPPTVDPPRRPSPPQAAPEEPAAPTPPASASEASATRDDIAQLREELEALKAALRDRG